MSTQRPPLRPDTLEKLEQLRNTPPREATTAHRTDDMPEEVYVDSIQAVRTPSQVITVSSLQELERAITAAITGGAPAVRGVKNGQSSWVFSHRTMEALVAQRKAKRQWWWTKARKG